mmetsp:Transcript_5325/g.11820  ORF Transcript_5325/g.11820 Transcript_5325/m.11820 type:complete len:263 (-) Transcript_5325:655-1443(-)
MLGRKNHAVQPVNTSLGQRDVGVGTCRNDKVFFHVRVGKTKPTSRVRRQVNLGLLGHWLAIGVFVALVAVKPDPDLAAANHEICAPFHSFLGLLHACESNNSVATGLPFAVFHYLHELDGPKPVHDLAERWLIHVRWQAIDEDAVRLLSGVVTIGRTLSWIRGGALSRNSALRNKPLRCLQRTRGCVGWTIAQDLRGHLARRDQLESVEPLAVLLLRPHWSESHKPTDVPVLHCLKWRARKESGSGAGNMVPRFDPNSQISN